MSEIRKPSMAEIISNRKTKKKKAEDEQNKTLAVTIERNKRNNEIGEKKEKIMGEKKKIDSLEKDRVEKHVQIKEEKAKEQVLEGYLNSVNEKTVDAKMSAEKLQEFSNKIGEIYDAEKDYFKDEGISDKAAMIKMFKEGEEVPSEIVQYSTAGAELRKNVIALIEARNEFKKRMPEMNLDFRVAHRKQTMEKIKDSLDGINRKIESLRRDVTEIDDKIKESKEKIEEDNKKIETLKKEGIEKNISTVTNRIFERVKDGENLSFQESDLKILFAEGGGNDRDKLKEAVIKEISSRLREGQFKGMQERVQMLFNKAEIDYDKVIIDNLKSAKEKKDDINNDRIDEVCENYEKNYPGLMNEEIQIRENHSNRELSVFFPNIRGKIRNLENEIVNLDKRKNILNDELEKIKERNTSHIFPWEKNKREKNKQKEIKDYNAKIDDLRETINKKNNEKKELVNTDNVAKRFMFTIQINKYLSPVESKKITTPSILFAFLREKNNRRMREVKEILGKNGEEKLNKLQNSQKKLSDENYFFENKYGKMVEISNDDFLEPGETREELPKEFDRTLDVLKLIETIRACENRIDNKSIEVKNGYICRDAAEIHNYVLDNILSEKNISRRKGKFFCFVNQGENALKPFRYRLEERLKSGNMYGDVSGIKKMIKLIKGFELIDSFAKSGSVVKEMPNIMLYVKEYLQNVDKDNQEELLSNLKKEFNSTELENQEFWEKRIRGYDKEKEEFNNYKSTLFDFCSEVLPSKSKQYEPSFDYHLKFYLQMSGGSNERLKKFLSKKPFDFSRDQLTSINDINSRINLYKEKMKDFLDNN